MWFCYGSGVVFPTPHTKRGCRSVASQPNLSRYPPEALQLHQPARQHRFLDPPVRDPHDNSLASEMLTTWHMPPLGSYNASALREIDQTPQNTGYPREFNPSATRDQCDSTRCSAWFGGPHATAATTTTRRTTHDHNVSATPVTTRCHRLRSRFWVCRTTQLTCPAGEGSFEP